MADMQVLQQLSNLMVDACDNKVGMFANENQVKYTNEAIREAWFDILGTSKLNYQVWRNNKDAIFTVMENVINSNLPSAWETSPFYREVVEYKNGALGQANAFVVKDKSVLIAHEFSGNHWNTERQKLGGLKEVMIPTHWVYIRFYDELERFLTRNTDIVTLMNEIRKGFNEYLDNKIAGSFNNLPNLLPSALKTTGTFDTDTLAELIDKTETAVRGNVKIYGSKSVMRNLVNNYPSHWQTDSQKEELATTGLVLNDTGLGVKGIVIPQSFVRNTYTYRNPNNVLYILPDSKLVKVYFEGKTWARERNEQDNEDMTIDTQIQTKVGVNLILENLGGVYTVTNS